MHLIDAPLRSRAQARFHGMGIEKEKEKFAAANPIPESQYQLDLSIISEQSENFGAYSRDSPTSSISIEESGDTFLIPDFHNDKASACSHNSINHNEVGNDNAIFLSSTGVGKLDNTALNGVRFKCSHSDKEVKSEEGTDGLWTDFIKCQGNDVRLQ